MKTNSEHKVKTTKQSLQQTITEAASLYKSGEASRKSWRKGKPNIGTPSFEKQVQQLSTHIENALFAADRLASKKKPTFGECSVIVSAALGSIPTAINAEVYPIHQILLRIKNRIDGKLVASKVPQEVGLLISQLVEKSAYCSEYFNEMQSNAKK